MRAVWVLVCLALLAGGNHGQEATATASGTLVQPGLLTSGRIDDRTAREVYTFDGSRGEVIRVTLAVTEGNLDPIMSVFDSAGEMLLNRDDATTADNALSATLSLQNDGRYYLVVGRFGYDIGTTAGDYALTLERVGVVSQQGSTLLFSVPVTDTISSLQPQVYYTFRATAGDIVTIEMQRTSGTLDPYLQLLDAQRFLIATNDDVVDGSSHNARIDNQLIEETGVYIVVASRYGEASGDSAGNYLLSVYEGAFSGLGNSTLAPQDILYNQPSEGTLDADRYQQFYRFNAQADDVITVSANQVGGTLDPTVLVTDMDGTVIAQDDDSGGGKNALLQKLRLPDTGAYLVQVQRFEGENGTTSGDYRVTITYDGSAFDGVNPGIPRVAYGTTIPDYLSDADPDSLYAFWGSEGEVVTVTMSRASGSLDPVLILMDDTQSRLLTNDDSGGSGNALIERYPLPYSGVYYINARRYEGANGDNNTEGAATVVLVRLTP